MNLFVTGGSGYLGASILRRAPKEWHLAATYVSHPIEQGNVAAFYLDVRDADAVNRVIAETHPDVVIHTAARMTGDAMFAVNTEGARHLARATHKIGARLIHLSSDVIFDGEQAPYNESAEPQPLIPYAISKAQAEQIVRAEFPDAIIVRTSLIYGFDPMDPRTRQVLNGDMPRLFTDEYRCPIFVDDLADALVELAQKETRFLGKLNLAGAQKLSRYDFGIALARAYRVEPKFAPALSASHPIPRPRDCALDISLAQRILNIRLRGVDEVLTQTNK
ncbi:MAG: NAD(P)-dependent oxidoreductase [Chloroflexi bacterium]|nr:NAD(P)-dependent oxidoreductase [Chloroflexota bacterium]